MKSHTDRNRLATVKDLDDLAANIITAITDTLKEYATKEDIQHLETKVDSLETKVDSLETKVDSLETKVDAMSSDVSDIRRRVIDLETDRIGRQEFTALKRSLRKAS